MSNQKQNDSRSPARSPEECGVSGARLVAGRELDALVAEKVMGWTGVGISSDENYTEYLEGFPPGPLRREDVPAYSTDIAAAWQVVEWLKERTEFKDIHLEHLESTGWGVSCCWKAKDGGWDGWRYAETAPLAICLAALKAVQSPANGEASNTGAQGVQSEGGRAEDE